MASVGRWQHKGGSIDLRGINTVQLIFSVSGGQEVELRSGYRCVTNTMREGSIAITSPDQPVIVTITGEAEVVHISITRETIEALAGTAASFTSPPVGCGPRLQAFAVQALVALAHDHDGYRPDLNSIVRGIACLFARPARKPDAAARGGLSPAARRRVRDLVEYRVDSTPCTSPSLAELADAAHLSVHHFARAFRESEGQTPHGHVLARRFGHALNLLLQPDARVAEVGEMSGFASPAHFVSAFRKHMGVTPGAVRNAVHARQTQAFRPG